MRRRRRRKKSAVKGYDILSSKSCHSSTIAPTMIHSPSRGLHRSLSVYSLFWWERWLIGLLLTSGLMSTMNHRLRVFIVYFDGNDGIYSHAAHTSGLMSTMTHRSSSVYSLFWWERWLIGLLFIPGLLSTITHRSLECLQSILMKRWLTGLLPIPQASWVRWLCICLRIRQC